MRIKAAILPPCCFQCARRLTNAKAKSVPNLRERQTFRRGDKTKAFSAPGFQSGGNFTEVGLAERDPSHRADHHSHHLVKKAAAATADCNDCALLGDSERFT